MVGNKRIILTLHTRNVDAIATQPPAPNVLLACAIIVVWRVIRQRYSWRYYYLPYLTPPGRVQSAHGVIDQAGHGGSL